jgi:putative transposase
LTQTPTNEQNIEDYKKRLKSHIVVDRNGFLMAVMVTAANIHDGRAACLLIRVLKEQGFKPIHKRWIVERTFAWFDYNRRLCPNYELTFGSNEKTIKINNLRLFPDEV